MFLSIPLYFDKISILLIVRSCLNIPKKDLMETDMALKALCIFKMQLVQEIPYHYIKLPWYNGMFQLKDESEDHFS